MRPNNLGLINLCNRNNEQSPSKENLNNTIMDMGSPHERKETYNIGENNSNSSKSDKIKNEKSEGSSARKKSKSTKRNQSPPQNEAPIKNNRGRRRSKSIRTPMKSVSNSKGNEKPKGCTCTKSNCKKRYCACYSKKHCCTKECTCQNCENINPNASTTFRPGGDSNKKAEIITCTCTKSNCKKKYCECYKSRKECNWLCRCVGCENCTERKKKFHSFQMEGISFEIKDSKAYLMRKKEGEEYHECDYDKVIIGDSLLNNCTPTKTLNRKTRRPKPESTNCITCPSGENTSTKRKNRRQTNQKALVKKNLNAVV
ncbi:MAG: TCR domain-containing protein [archaeon]|nr:TCR domain-containing protein [archaeon]